MNFRSLSLAALCIFCACPVLAQKDGSPEPPMVVLKMPKFSIGDFPKKSVAVSGIQIIQTVWDSTRLGYVQKGTGNYVVAIRPAKPLTIFLQEHFDKSYKDDFETGGVKLLWIVKDLRVTERTTIHTNFAYTRLNADAYISDDGIRYTLAASLDTVLVASGAEVTPWHGERIENAFKLLLHRSLKNAKTISETSGTVSVPEILANENQKADTPILQQDTYADGLYVNFREFAQNKPSVTVYLPVNVGKNKIRFISLNENNGMDTLQAWGICRNGEIYKYYEDQLIPIEKQGNGFIISDYVEKVNRSNHNAFAEAMLEGIAGQLLIAAIGSSPIGKNKPCLVRSIPYLKKNLPEASSIDMNTGELTF